MLAPPPGMPMPPFMPSPTAAGNLPPEMPPEWCRHFRYANASNAQWFDATACAFSSPQQFPPPQNMFGMYGMMPQSFSPQFRVNMNMGSPQFPGLPLRMPAQPNVGGNRSSPLLRRSQSTLNKATRASKLQAIQRQIEMLEAHLKEISPGKKSTLKQLNQTQWTPQGSPKTQVGGRWWRGRWSEPSATVPEINLDEQQRNGDETPQALRRQQLPLPRRLSSKEQWSVWCVEER